MRINLTVLAPGAKTPLPRVPAVAGSSVFFSSFPSTTLSFLVPSNFPISFASFLSKSQTSCSCALHNTIKEENQVQQYSTESSLTLRHIPGLPLVVQH
jgi:hypothetical protein